MAIPYEHRCTCLISYQPQGEEQEQRLHADFQRLFGISCYKRMFPGLAFVVYGTTPASVYSKLRHELPDFRQPFLISQIPEGSLLALPSQAHDEKMFVQDLLPKLELVL